MTAVDTLIADLRKQRTSGYAQPVIVPVDSFVAALNELAAGGGPAGGDLSGTFPNPVVDGIQSQPVSAAAPLAGQQLKFIGGVWTPT